MESLEPSCLPASAWAWPAGCEGTELCRQSESQSIMRQYDDPGLGTGWSALIPALCISPWHTRVVAAESRSNPFCPGICAYPRACDPLQETRTDSAFRDRAM